MELESNLMNAYSEAYKLACKQLATLDWESVAMNTNSIYNGQDKISLVYLNNEYEISCNSGKVKLKGKSTEVTTTIKVLILHYLINTGKNPLTGNLISFREIKGGGSIYYQTFQKRAVSPLVKTFGQDPGRLLHAGTILGGTIEKYGNASVTLDIFPMVPVTYVVWQGDEEVPSAATILFDDSVTNFLPAEDIVLAASFGTYELMKHASGGAKNI